MIIACIALFVALGGSSYAAIRILRSETTLRKGHSSETTLRKGHREPSKSVINAAVAKYFKSHHSQFVGPRGPEGSGSQGPAGLPGERGPAGLASESSRLAGPVTTGSASMVNLGGPSVTVKVGPSGLVAYWATATLKSEGGGTAEVVLTMPSGYAPQLENSSSSPITIYTQPGSDNGTNIFNAGLSTVYVGPGTRTLSLEYSDSGGVGVFEDIELDVIPL